MHLIGVRYWFQMLRNEINREVGEAQGIWTKGDAIKQIRQNRKNLCEHLSSIGRQNTNNRHAQLHRKSCFQSLFFLEWTFDLMQKEHSFEKNRIGCWNPHAFIWKVSSDSKRGAKKKKKIIIAEPSFFILCPFSV